MSWIVKEDRFYLWRTPQNDHFEKFKRDVYKGLSAERKSLPPKYFYDARGSKLFEQICTLPEYYQTRTEDAILRLGVGHILELADYPKTIVELGSGSSLKTQRLIHGLLEQSRECLFVPIDISESILTDSAHILLRCHPSLIIRSLHADYHKALLKLPSIPGKKLILWLGSSIGNMSPSEKVDFLKRICSVMSKDDFLLIGFDLIKGRDILERAYNDEAGITAAFNKNILVRINNELGGDFITDQFDHYSFYNEDHLRIEMHLVSNQRQAVGIDEIQCRICLEKGESIHTENSYKFDSERIYRTTHPAGFRQLHSWRDEDDYFEVGLFSKIES